MKILKTSFCSVCDRELLSRHSDAFVMMKVHKRYAVVQFGEVIMQTDILDDAATCTIDSENTRYLIDSADDTIATQGYINSNKIDYFSDYGHGDDYDDGYVDDDYSDDDVEYMSMRDREISSYSF